MSRAARGSIGYEIDARLVQESRDAVARENLGDLTSIQHQDIFTLDLSDAYVITVFLYPRLMDRLIPQLEKLKSGSRIISHQFEMPAGSQTRRSSWSRRRTARSTESSSGQRR